MGPSGLMVDTPFVFLIINQIKEERVKLFDKGSKRIKRSILARRRVFARAETGRGSSLGKTLVALLHERSSHYGSS